MIKDITKVIKHPSAREEAYEAFAKFQRQREANDIVKAIRRENLSYGKLPQSIKG